ncbi:hypothetical protein CRU96_07025 [Malaciobacter halophilus]|nr:hypothetical protein [Malaciobacter halophilus]RYA23623.1 hypothetical protein CRU96_07025 [Malaciobacter halophilus]
MSNIKVIIRTPDQTRKAEVEVSEEFTGGDILENAVSNWNLPTDTDYQLALIDTNTMIQPAQSLKDAKVSNGSLLEVQPVLVAGV